MVGQVLEHGLIGVASIESDEEPAGGGSRVGIASGAQLADLLNGTLAEAGGAHGDAVFGLRGFGGLFPRLGGSRGMAKGDGDDAAVAIGRGKDQGSLEETLGAYEIGLKARTQRVAAPSHARGAQAGAAHQRVIEHGADGSAGGEFAHHRAPYRGEEMGEGQARFGKEPITGGPVTKRPAEGGPQGGG
jgi:hypothetical protein